MNRINFIGSFPPPFGGVTIKNELLFKKLSNEFDVKKEPRDSKIGKIFYLIRAVFGKNPLIIGISAVRGKSLLITKILYLFNRFTMYKSLYFMMGGLEANRIASNVSEIKMYSTYKKVFVETKTMQNVLTSAGLNNVELYPNCREKTERKIETNIFNKCVFFSYISKKKGADMVLQIADTFPHVFRVNHFFRGIDATTL